MVWPGDEESYAKLLSGCDAKLHFVRQAEPRGYAHSVFCAREFVGGEPFLHFVGDHIYVGSEGDGCARRLVEAATSRIAQSRRCRLHARACFPSTAQLGGNRYQANPDFTKWTRY